MVDNINTPMPINDNTPTPALDDNLNLLANAKHKIAQDNIIQELLKVACKTDHLEGKTLKDKIDIILNLRVKNEVMINSLLEVAVANDQLSMEAAAQINNRNKDSLSDLVRVKQLLEGLPTERISVEDEEYQFKMARLSRMGSSGTPDLGSAN